MHASDQLCAWAQSQLRDGVATAPADDRGPAEIQAAHSGGAGRGPGTPRSGAGGGPGPADIEGARSRSHGPAAERPELRLIKPESTHCWTNLIDGIMERCRKNIKYCLIYLKNSF